MKSLNRIILISFLMLGGCTTSKPSVPLKNVKWPMPPTPVKYTVDFVEKDNGLYLTKTNAIYLLKNINSMQAYTDNLELLVKAMKKYYHAEE